MSLHIGMTDEADKALQKAKTRNFLAALATAILSTALAGLLLYTAVIVVSKTEKPEIVAYVANNTDAPPQDSPVTPERITTRPTASVQNHASIITSNAVSDVAIASVDLETPDISDLGQSLELGVDFGAGVGEDLGEGGTGFGSDQPGGSALEGTFYDLKQTPAGKSTNMTYAEYINVFNQFIKNWNRSILNKYFKSPTKLYASQFYIPNSPSEDAPKAYQCGDRVQGSFWAAVYKGNVVAPKSGKFRFVGAADDVLVVNFNGKNVFDFGWSQVSINQSYAVGKAWHDALQNVKGADEVLVRKLRQSKINVPPVTLYKYENTEHWNQNTGGYAAGVVFTVEAGKTYPIQILLGDNGGQFGESLMIEEVDAPVVHKDQKYGSPIFPLFRTNYSLPDPATIKGQVAPFDPVGIVWPVVR
ncbi:hypothetical protein QET93_003840 [Akkermansia sp. N21116]|uniref:hypothetical protein n=1 Tax=Akkermansia sp. N21116 TaxID=3040764 RepID=UPI00244EE1AE|nr:hypothetical protein [Akkermansia sp. N21116]WPX41234.1 hypothetical protein QET93_003840 [Akkermansia sp. N21116]